MSQQLVKKDSDGRYSNVMPKSWIEAIKDKSTGQSLVETLQGFNMYFLYYNGNTSATRCSVPMILRKKGLWITYVKYDGNVYTEWYAGSNIDDKSWGNSSNWRIGNNTLVGDITISANGNWVINGAETKFKAVGEKGNTPLIRVANNRLQVSYDLGDTYRNVTENPVYTQFRNYNNKIQVSTDLGATWTDASDEIAAYFRWQVTTKDTQANNVGRLQISRDNKTWTNLSNDIINNLHISKYIGANEPLPTSGIAEGTIYAKGPTYAVEDTSNSNPIYRLWVYAWKGNTLAWQDNGEFTSIAAGIVQETGSNENAVMSQKATSAKFTELEQGIIYDVSAHNDNAVFESLSALLSSPNLSTLIPTSVRRGGMSIRFLQGSEQSSYNNYVQYMYTGNSVTGSPNPFLNVSNWKNQSSEINTLVFTNDKNGANNIIRHLFFDTSGYTGTVSLSGMRIRTLSNGWGDLWGFSLENGDGTLIIAPWKATNEQIFEGFALGIYYYCNFNWDNMVSVDHINTIELTSECYKKYNDPRNLLDGCVVTTENLANGSVTTEKLANGAANDEKVDGRLLESKFINAIGKFEYNITQIVLNAYLIPNGNPNNMKGWGYVRYIPLIPNTIITMPANTLGYIIKYRALYDKDKQFISETFGACGGPIDCDSVIASNPTAKYIGIDLIDSSESGSGTTELTIENTADWVVIIKSKYSEKIADLDNRVTALENNSDAEKKNTFVFSSGESSIISSFDSTNNFKLDFNITRTVDNSQNPCFNFVRAKLVNKSTSSETLVHSCSDDICPGNYNRTYIGANHGQDVTTITAANHGKTFVDIGSKWTDGTHNFYIVAILGTNEIQMLSDNQSTYPYWSFIMPNIGTLTHVSGATHTDDIIITARITSQIHPIMNLQSTKIIIDGEEITQNGTYNFDKLKISQIYDVRNSASILAQIISRVGQFTENPIYSQLGADKVMRHSITYEFNSAQECTITTDFLAYQNVNLGYFGFTQQGVLNGDNVKMYIPKALPISNGQATIDFRTIVEHNSVPSTMNLTSEYWENRQLPPDRWIQFANNISFVGGYLFDKGVGGNRRKDAINNAFFLYTSRKCYPYGIDSKIALTAGKSYSAVNIRKYIPVVSTSIPNNICTMFEYNGELYIYFDAWANGIYTIKIPTDYVNGELLLFEKSNNVEMLSSSVNVEMLIQVTTSSPMYGYYVAKISR